MDEENVMAKVAVALETCRTNGRNLNRDFIKTQDSMKRLVIYKKQENSLAFLPDVSQLACFSKWNILLKNHSSFMNIRRILIRSNNSLWDQNTTSCTCLMIRKELVT